ncbi:hypothetical protein PENSOL_c024G04225 [Penicillium solitum]|uniref:USP domain-containing protein n=1 Tax=Penicillium solitum TaxID=60172 RepID=A0A1V6R008_9EURO|nr:uncharacterized protein PENSOL_c024G04225 [Penicillium solitum]OQD94788.1 hypothetical protein PENSOL_c024G04225 [Penicillium solitum]
MAEPKKVEELPEKYPPVFDDELEEEEEEEEEVVEKAVEEEDVSDEDEEEEEPEGEEEVEDLTEQREKSAEDKRTLRTVIPTYWNPDFPDKTTVGFPNGGVDCYRNSAFQMILHMPIFYNWLIWYKEHHAPKGHVCLLGPSEDGPSECEVCQLAEIAQGYWAGQAETESWMPTFKSLTNSLLRAWKPAGVDSEQDPAEYFDELYGAIKKRTKPMMKEDLEDMLEVELIMAMRCAGKAPCNPKYISRRQRFMMINLSGEEGDKLPEKPTLSDVIDNHFDHEDDFGACADCGGTKTAKEQIGNFPELLLVQLNRTSVTGKKIHTHVYLTEQLNIETRFMDERWGNKRKVVQYKLTSVVLHHGEDVTKGHYSIGVKGKGDKWSMANDTQILDWDPEGPGGNPNHLATGYLFTYRRLPTNDEVQKPQTEGTPDSESFEKFDSEPPEDSEDPENPGDPAPEGPIPKSGSNVFDPKVVDSYIARSADARRKEWEKWADGWEKKRKTAQTAEAAEAAKKAKAAKTSTSAIGSAIDSDTGSNGDIVDWPKKRGRLQITLTEDAGKGARVLDLEVQGLHYNRLKRKKGEKADEADEEEVKEKESTFNKIKKKVQGKAKDYGDGKKKKK